MNAEFETQLANAVALHQSGEIAQAESLYRSLYQQQPERLDVKHNLGAVLLGLGKLKEGAQLLGEAINSDPSNEGMLSSRKLLGLELYKNSFWEEAIPWLLEAIQNDPDDVEVASVLNRISPRRYLEPEHFDPLAKQTLKRYSPREADSYIYTIDIVGNCNLRCPSCPVGNSTDIGRFKKMMSLDVFTQVLKKISAETPSSDAQIWLYNWGEPLLHPKLPEMVSAIREAGFRSYLSSNLNIEKGLKELIKAKPDELKISLSGFDAQTYESTHTKGDIHLVKSNFYRLRKYIDQYQSPTRVWVGHHIYKNNFHQVEQVRALCDELGFEHHPTQAFYQPLEKLMLVAEGDKDVLKEPILDNLLVRPELQIKHSKTHQLGDYDCELRFNQMVINADATVALCCTQYNAENTLGMSFLEHTHQALVEQKYENELCVKCRSAGLDFAPKALPVSIQVDNG